MGAALTATRAEDALRIERAVLTDLLHALRAELAKDGHGLDAQEELARQMLDAIRALREVTAEWDFARLTA